MLDQDEWKNFTENKIHQNGTLSSKSLSTFLTKLDSSKKFLTKYWVQTIVFYSRVFRKVSEQYRLYSTVIGWYMRLVFHTRILILVLNTNLSILEQEPPISRPINHCISNFIGSVKPLKKFGNIAIFSMIHDFFFDKS